MRSRYNTTGCVLNPRFRDPTSDYRLYVGPGVRQRALGTACISVARGAFDFSAVEQYFAECLLKSSKHVCPGLRVQIPGAIPRPMRTEFSLRNFE